MARTASNKAISPAPGRRRREATSPPQAGAPAQSGRASPRAERQAQRREAILAAALDEFSARGFAATRLDDVAKRAGVAKGTIYLYFRDKESLFQELVRSMLGPQLSVLEAAQTQPMPVRRMIEQFFERF